MTGWRCGSDRVTSSHPVTCPTDALYQAGVYDEALDSDETGEKISKETDEKTREKTSIETREKVIGDTTKETDTIKETREKTRETIIRLIKENSTITTSDLASETGITEKGIEYHIDKLKSDKVLIRVGPDKGGRWEILTK